MDRIYYECPNCGSEMVDPWSRIDIDKDYTLECPTCKRHYIPMTTLIEEKDEIRQ